MLKFFIITSLILLPGSLLFSQKTNQYNKKGHRTGKWITYTDSTKTKKTFDGKYRDGVSIGKCLYYTSNGTLEKRELNRFGKMRIAYYFPNGKVNYKGKARIENQTKKVHFYFYGKWKYYNDSGKLISYGYYNKGELIKMKSAIKTNHSKDTFCTVLPQIESSFLSKNKFLLDTLALCWNSPSLAEKYRNKIYQADSLSFKRLENSLNYYGYPQKEECQEASNVPFFIISHAPLKIREENLEFFKAAAALGNINKSSMAFYIDKIKVAKGEKQIYGTQFYLNKEREKMFYPCYDPDNLTKRRQEMGLEAER